MVLLSPDREQALPESLRGREARSTGLALWQISMPAADALLDGAGESLRCFLQQGGGEIRWGGPALSGQVDQHPQARDGKVWPLVRPQVARPQWRTVLGIPVQRVSRRLRGSDRGGSDCGRGRAGRPCSDALCLGQSPPVPRSAGFCVRALRLRGVTCHDQHLSPGQGPFLSPGQTAYPSIQETNSGCILVPPPGCDWRSQGQRVPTPAPLTT